MRKLREAHKLNNTIAYIKLILVMSALMLTGGLAAAITTTESTIKDEQESKETNTNSEASEQWAKDSERLESTESAQEGASEDSPPTDAELPPEPSAELLRLQAENVQLTRERDDRAREAAAAALDGQSQEMAVRFAQNLVNSGETEESARMQAEAERRVWVAEQRLLQSEARGDSQKLGFERARISRESGVSEESLKVFTTVDQMEQHVKLAGPIEKRLTAVEQRNGQKDRNEAAPVQQYNNQGSTRSAANGNYAEKLKSGAALPSASEIDQITAKYLQ